MRELPGSLAVQGQAQALALLATVHLSYANEPEEALAALDEADRLLDQEAGDEARVGLQRVEQLVLRADVLSSLGRFDEAVIAFKKASEIAREEEDVGCISRYTFT